MTFNNIYTFRGICFIISILINIISISSQVNRLNLSFDDCTTQSPIGSAKVITEKGVKCECGAIESGLEFDGKGFLAIDTSINKYFRSNFVVSFYMSAQPTDRSKVMDIVSLSNECTRDSQFLVSYLPLNNQLIINFQPIAGFGKSFSVDLKSQSCFRHIAIVYQISDFFIYENGVLIRQEKIPNNQIRTLINYNNLKIGGHGDVTCPSPNIGFQGLLDEVKIIELQSSIKPSQIAELYHPLDQIQNIDTTILRTKSVQIQGIESCEVSFAWEPTTGISDHKILNPLITPLVSTKYALTINGTNCVTKSEINISVVDSFNCEKLFIPTAFTPNGDGINDYFKIDNPNTIGKLNSFKIYNTSGTEVFNTTDKLFLWDGKFKGTALNPNYFLYTINYFCSGQVYHKTDSFVLMK